MDKIRKNLTKIPLRERQKIQLVYSRIINGDLNGLDVRKLAGSQAFFRVRVGDYRIIFQILKNNQNIVVAILKRDDRTYSDF